MLQWEQKPSHYRLVAINSFEDVAAFFLEEEQLAKKKQIMIVILDKFFSTIDIYSCNICNPRRKILPDLPYLKDAS